MCFRFFFLFFLGKGERGGLDKPFIGFEDPYQAGRARDLLQNFKITPTNQMKISYAKQ